MKSLYAVAEAEKRGLGAIFATVGDHTVPPRARTDVADHLGCR
jgi:hypothetical protein